MGIVKKLFNSTRKPEGLLGELMVKSMNRRDMVFTIKSMSDIDILKEKNINIDEVVLDL